MDSSQSVSDLTLLPVHTETSVQPCVFYILSSELHVLVQDLDVGWETSSSWFLILAQGSSTNLGDVPLQVATTCFSAASMYTFVATGNTGEPVKQPCFCLAVSPVLVEDGGEAEFQEGTHLLWAGYGAYLWFH